MKYLFFLVLTMLCFSCTNDTATLKVQNKVHNVRLESINWGEYPIAYSLITGETSEEYVIEDKAGTFPKINKLKFLMVGNGKQVYLETKAYYQLDADQTLTIVVSDTTAVTNPAK